MDRITVTINAESARVLESWKAVRGVKQVSAEDGTLTILADDSNRVLPRLFEAAAALACASPPSPSRNPTWKRSSCT